MFFIVPSSAPVGLNYSNPLPDSLTLTWRPPPPQHQNGDIVNYLIDFTDLASINSTVSITNSTSLDVAGLQPFTSYAFSVSAATAVGFGPASEHFIVQTAEDG